MKEYVYRRHLREVKRSILYIMSYFVSLFLIYGVVSLITLERKERIQFIEGYWKVIGAVLLVIVLSALILYVTYFRNLKDIKVFLYEDKIMYKNRFQEKTIYFHNIDEIYSSHHKFSRGSINIKSKNDIIKIKLSLEDVSGFIQNLKSNLDNKNMKNLYNSKKVYDYYKVASYIDDSWERIYELLKFVPPIIGIDVVLSFIISFLVEDYYIKFLIVIILFVFPIVLLAISELILVIKHTIELKNEQYVVRMRDYQYEHRVFDAVLVILMIMVSTILIYLIIKY